MKAAQRILDSRTRETRNRETLTPVVLSSLVFALGILALALLLCSAGRGCPAIPTPEAPLPIPLDRAASL